MGELAVDRLIALPELTGPHIRGLPSAPYGFIPIDSFCRSPARGQRQRAGARMSVVLPEPLGPTSPAIWPRRTVVQDLGPRSRRLFTMFLVNSVAILHERRTGTLERLLATPLRKSELLAGYGLAFGAAAIAQAVIASAVASGPSACTSPAEPRG